MTVSIRCESTAEAALARNAVNRYRHVLKSRGVDPRNYAPHNAEGAGFGWDAVQRMAGDMSAEGLVHVSARMARAFRDALADKAEHTTSRDSRRIARILISRVDRALATPGPDTEGWICPNMPFGHDWKGGTTCPCGATRTAGEAIVSLLAGLPGFDQERAAALVAQHDAELTA